MLEGREASSPASEQMSTAKVTLTPVTDNLFPAEVTVSQAVVDESANSGPNGGQICSEKVCNVIG